MAIRTVQWGTGTAGLRALRCILANPALELAGLYVARAERVGRDAGSFLDLPDTGVITTNDRDALLALQPECLCYMGSFADGGYRDFLPFLRSGCNVVTPSVARLLTPFYAPAEDRAAVEAACSQGGSSFLSTGASPGFCTDLFPMTMLGIVDEIRAIRVQEIADYSSYPVQAVARKWGFGAQPGDSIALFDSGAVEQMWHHVPRDIARRLGVEIDAIRVVAETGTTPRDVETAFYTIPAGTIANIRFEVQGLVRGRPFVTLEHVNYCDYDAMPDHWPRPDARTALAYRTEITGRPTLTAEIALDYPVAAIRTVNAIPAVVAASPGILAGADIAPLASGHVVWD